MDLSEKKTSAPPDFRRHFWELARRDAILDAMRRHLVREHAGAILDFGCGDGFLLRAMTGSFPERSFLAVDNALTPEEMRQLETGGRIRCATTLAPGDAATVAAVTLFDLLEHLEDDRGFLSGLAGETRPGTMFFITVPAGSKLFSEHDRTLRHYRRYERKELTGVLTEAKLEILECWNFFVTLRWMRQLSNLTGTQNPPVGSGAIRPEWLNRVFAEFLKMEGVSERRIHCRLPGLSLGAVCRKI